ncbi:hypothetical protein J3R82DRAFT_7784 [Butyriboletus roseoflavus]|nr:hypothetical protein J3R82DRAFT_7784 [Butyriboletus roseoflavus]
MAGQADVFLLLIVAFIFPPVAVAFVAGCGSDLCLNILLTMLGYFPGCIHALWLVLRRAEANNTYGYKNWTYSGMGEYTPIHAQRYSSLERSTLYGQPPPPPPPPPPSQAHVDQKQGGGYAPLPAPADQKAVKIDPLVPADQKPANPTASPSGI